MCAKELLGDRFSQETFDSMKNEDGIISRTQFEVVCFGPNDIFKIAQSDTNLSVLRDINVQDIEGCTALFLAVWFNDVQAAQKLINAGADLERAEYDYGITPLLLAAMDNRVSLVQVLLTAGANINAIDKNGNTPLIIATEWNFRRCVRVLVEHGAALHLMNNANKSALDFAKEKVYKEVNYILQRASDPMKLAFDLQSARNRSNSVQVMGSTAAMMEVMYAGAIINEPKDKTYENSKAAGDFFSRAIDKFRNPTQAAPDYKERCQKALVMLNTDQNIRTDPEAFKALLDDEGILDWEAVECLSVEYQNEWPKYLVLLKRVPALLFMRDLGFSPGTPELQEKAIVALQSIGILNVERLTP